MGLYAPHAITLHYVKTHGKEVSVLGRKVSHKSKLEILQNRASKIINGHNGEISLPSIDFLQNQRCAIEVFKCLNGLAPRKLDNHFKRLDHQKDTRGNKLNLVVSRIRTETARQAFSYQGVEIYNRLPPELTSENSFARFKKGCNDFDFSFQETFLLYIPVFTTFLLLVYYFFTTFVGSRSLI